ncbi:MAG: hypothetical protein LBK95_05900 [Bifidobacteriaceae bacterium]|nr:hypothetical protein [Bifidobacteriaceae bacterium]
MSRPEDRAAAAGPDGGGWGRFADPECLRRLLVRLGRDGWGSDPEAEELIRHCIDRFGSLARKHGLEPEDAGPAAFEAMRNPSVRWARDPWAVVVKAVATTMRAAQFADEALCSVETARRGGLSGRRAERFSEREAPVWERRPELAQEFRSDLDDDAGDDAAPVSVHEQAARVAVWLRSHGWRLDTAWTATEVVMRRLADAGSRAAAYEQLRKDRHARAVTDLPARSWAALLRLLLGCPDPDKALTAAGKGVLLRLALGETFRELDADRALARAAALAAPDPVRRT